MFAELEVLTDKTSAAILSIPNSAVVEANNKKQVYVQNGNAYQPVEVTLGQISGDMVEVKTNLFEGDSIVTQRATQLYAQSLRGGSKAEEHEDNKAIAQPTQVKRSNLPIPLWLIGVGGAALASVAFVAGRFSLSKRTKELVSIKEFSDDVMSQTTLDDNHHVSQSKVKKLSQDA